MHFNLRKQVKKQIPNVLSSVRMIIAFVILFFMSAMSENLVLGLFCAGALTDFFDGFLARKLSATSKFGAILDPISDKFFMNTIMWFLYKNCHIGLVFFYISFFRDVMIIIGAVLLNLLSSKKKATSGISVRFIGKLSTTLHMLLCIHILIFKNTHILMLYFVGAVIMMSFFRYLMDFLVQIKRLKKS